MRLQQLKEGVGAGGEIERLTELLKVAKAQKGITWCILLGLVLYCVLLAGGSTNPHPGAASIAISVGGLVGLLILMPFQLIYVYRLASALDVGAPFLWAAGVFLCSCFGLVLLLILSSKATKVLREAGFKVGLMGANITEIENAIAHGR